MTFPMKVHPWSGRSRHSTVASCLARCTSPPSVTSALPPQRASSTLPWPALPAPSFPCAASATTRGRAATSLPVVPAENYCGFVLPITKKFRNNSPTNISSGRCLLLVQNVRRLRIRWCLTAVSRRRGHSIRWKPSQL